MNEVIRKEIIGFLQKIIDILEVREEKDIEDLKLISDQTIKDAAIHKDGDAVSIAVLAYSLYKIIKEIPEKDYQQILSTLGFAKKDLQEKNLGRYNKDIQSLFELIKKSNAKVKVHLQDVLTAARIKEGEILFRHGLSMGRAASMLGITKWDILGYSGRTTSSEQHTEKMSAKKRLELAISIFGK